MSTKKNKILFVDWHETVSKDKFFSSLHSSKSKRYNELAHSIEDFLFVKNKKYVSKWMLGKATSEEVILFVSQGLNIDYDWLWQVFEKDCKNMLVHQKIRSKLEELKNFYYLILITGNMDCFNRFTIPSQGLDKLFDSIVNSSDVGYFKDERNGQAFTDVINEKRVSAYHCYLIDDNKTVCDVFDKLGGASMNVHISKVSNIQKRLHELFVKGPNLMLPFHGSNLHY